MIRKQWRTEKCRTQIFCWVIAEGARQVKLVCYGTLCVPFVRVHLTVERSPAPAAVSNPKKHTHMNASSSSGKHKYDYQHKPVRENKLSTLRGSGIQVRKARGTHTCSPGVASCFWFFLNFSFTFLHVPEGVFFNVEWLPASNDSNMSENNNKKAAGSFNCGFWHWLHLCPQHFEASESWM